ncbi:hypothetical protein ABZ341_03040 [Streptomyces sp. NPDC006173]
MSIRSDGHTIEAVVPGYVNPATAALVAVTLARRARVRDTQSQRL